MSVTKNARPMPFTLPFIKKPELVIAIAGPIGVDMGSIVESLGDALRAVHYQPLSIRLTEEMEPFLNGEASSGPDFFSDSLAKMHAGTSIRRRWHDPAALARIAVLAIRARRLALRKSTDTTSVGVAYILRQLKRPEEVQLLRQLYNRQFLLVSAYGSREQRKALLESHLRRGVTMRMSPTEISSRADQLIDTDAEEKDRHYGQQLRDTFHRGDVFIDGLTRSEMDAKVVRFVQALFGRVDIGPLRDEFGMYAASSAALRSTDLSRQVGAAIFTDDGELIAQGCNEVPKAFGGAYWDSETPDFRDVRIGYDPNAAEIRDVVRDLLQRLSDEKLLSRKALQLGDVPMMVDKLTARDGILKDSSILDLTEYGRVVHAEMHAICEAARLGRSIKGTTLYCTTFPCHNCTKHILAAGIRRVIYIEPYPKSLAKVLHAHEIEVEGDSMDRVEFKPFLGISPSLYRDIFQKARRKRPDGSARRWYQDEERPMIDITYPSYLRLEQEALQELLGTMTGDQPTGTEQ